MKRTILRNTLFLTTLLITLTIGLKADTVLTLSGSLDLMRRSGSENDYLAGVSDFCITEPHSITALGLSIRSQKRIYWGFEAQYALPGQAVMIDPSDDDRVTIDSYQRLSGSLILGVNLIRTEKVNGALELAGGGVYLLNAKTIESTSWGGYETIIEAPEKSIGAQGFLGATVTYYFTPSFGLTLGGRYQLFFLSPRQSAVSLLAGVSFTL